MSNVKIKIYHKKYQYDKNKMFLISFNLLFCMLFFFIFE